MCIYTINFLFFCNYRYKRTFERLKGLKTEIDHLQHLHQRSKIKLQNDFQDWWTQEAARLQVSLYSTALNKWTLHLSPKPTNAAVSRGLILHRHFSDPVRSTLLMLCSNIWAADWAGDAVLILSIGNMTGPSGHTSSCAALLGPWIFPEEMTCLSH